jgi:hypothetical protein
VTDEHPFYVVGTGWTPARVLEEGDTLLGADGMLIRVTDEHPFYVAGKGWTAARLLDEGDTLIGAHGTLIVSANAGEGHSQGVMVYNLEVEQSHTYFVLTEDAGDVEAVWVHNANGYSFANRGNGGRGGGTSHASVQDDIYRIAGGGQEVPILGSGGRIADNLDSLGRIHQIGDMRWRGGFRPSARERGAIEDIRKAVGSSVEIIFHDKHGIGPSLINPDLQPGWRTAPIKYRKNI